MNGALIQNTLILGGATAFMATVGAFSVLLLSLCLPVRLARWVPVLAAMNLLLPHFLMITVWMEWFGYAGMLGSKGADWFYGIPGAVILLSLLLWPVSYFCLLTRRAALIRSACYLDPFLGGGSFVRLMVFHLRQPVAWGGVLVFALSVNQLAVPGILQVRVLTEEILVRFNTQLDLVAVSWLGLPLFLSALVVAIAVYRSDFGRDYRWVPVSPVLIRQRVGWIGLIGLGGVAVLMIGGGLVFPLYRLLGADVTWRDLGSTFHSSQRAMMFSMLFASAAATIILVMGLCCHRYRMARFALVGLLVPGTVLGAYLATVNNAWYAMGIDLGWGIVVLAMALRFFAVGVSGSVLAFQGADCRYAEMSRLEGLDWRQRFLQCVWPQSGGALLATWWFAYLLCLWEVEVLIFMIPPGLETLGLRIFNLLHYGHNSQVNASCLLLLCMGFAPWIVWRLGRLLPWGRGQVNVVCALIVVGGSGAGCGTESPVEGKLESQFFTHAEGLGRKGTGVGQFNKPRSVAVGGEDEVFAVDMTGRVQRFDSTGSYLGFWQMPETERGRPKGMGVDAKGRIVVVEPHYARVNHFTPDGELRFQWGLEGVAPGSLAFPRAIGLHSSGDLFVTEFQQVERVQRFLPEGKGFVHSFGQAGPAVGCFNRAEGIGIDASDRVYVADSCNHRIQVFDDQGTPLAQYGRAGGGLGELSYPYDVRVDSDGFQFVCEFGNSRIQVFDPSYQAVELIGGPGSALGQFSNPWSIALDSKGNLWVADSGNHRLQKLVRRVREP